MKVHENDPCPRFQRVDLLQHDTKRVVDVDHEDAAHDIDHANGDAGRRPREIAAVPRCGGGVVSWPQQARLDADVVQSLFFIPDVVARGHYLDAEVEQLLADFASDAEASRGVLGVRDDEID